MKASTRWALAAPPLAFLAVFFVWPVVTIVTTGLTPDGHLDPGAVLDVLRDGDLRGVAWFTLWQAVASTVLTLAVALPGAYVFARFRFRGKGLLWSALIVPFVLPTLVVGTAFLQLLGPSGPFGSVLGGVDLRYTVWAVLLAHTFFNYAVVVRTVGGFWAHVDPSLAEAARMLGATPWQAFRRVTLPLLAPSIAAAAVIVFIFTFTSFGVVLVLGGPALHTLEVEIYTQTFSFLRLDVAAVLAVVQLVAVVAALVAYERVAERRTRTMPLVAAEVTARPVRGVRDRLILGANLAVIAVLLATPLVWLAVRSFSTASGWALTYYQALGEVGRGSATFVPPVEAIVNSVLFALAATVLAVLLGGAASFALAGRGRSATGAGGRRALRWFDTALMIPLGTSAVTIGFGFLITLDSPPLDLRSSSVLVPIAQALVALPLVVRSVVPALRAIDPRLREAAMTLGASPAKAWRAVELPIVGRALAVGAGFAFAVSLGEFGATVFLARPDRPTVPVAIGRLLGQPGALNVGRAMALATILMVLTTVAMVLIERARSHGVGEF